MRKGAVGFVGLFIAMFGALLGANASANTVTSTITANFNGTAIAQGNYIWFNAVINPTPAGTGVVQYYITNSTISFTANSVNYSLSVPNSVITFDPSLNANLPQATVGFSSNTWSVTAPKTGLAGNTFLDGLAYQVTTSGGLPGGIQNVTWSADFSTSTAGSTLQWQWAAAVYSTFTNSYSSLNVKPVDDNNASVYANSDHAGTPEQTSPKYKDDVTGGATGGGGSNWTGSTSSTASVSPPTVPVPSSLMGGGVLLGLIAVFKIRRLAF